MYMKKNKWGNVLLTASLGFGLLNSVIPSSFAEGPTDPAPEIQATVINSNAGKKVLVDNTHGQTAGAADWVINGGFSDFGNGLANDGFYVKELRKNTPITYADLQNYDMFVLPEANIPYKKSEQDAMLQYIQNGGSIFFIADHYNADRNKNRWDASEVFNGYRRGAWTDPAKGMTTEEASSQAMQGVESSDWLASNFGVRFRYNAIGDVTANQIVSPDQSFNITQGVSTVAMHAGSTLAIVDPKKAKGIVYLPTNIPKWANAVDQGVYNGGGVAEGPYVAVAKIGLGKAAFIGDSSAVEDATPKYVREDTGQKKTTYDGYKEQNDAKLLNNITDWLAQKENYTSLDQVAGLQLDQPTALASFEQPSQSAEPKAEPWAAPPAGYKWYDPSTFKAGSYGYPTTVITQNGYGFSHPSVLPNSRTFQITVYANGLTPNTTYNNYSVGIYTGSGLQVAKIQNTDGTWPLSYGYSAAFSLTTDSNGHAEKVLNVQIQSGTVGSGNLRLRQGTTAKVTEAVTIN